MKNLTYPSVTEVSDLILQRVYEKNGKIESFCWKNGICSFSFYGCRPDEIIFDKACSVSYSSNNKQYYNLQTTFWLEYYSERGIGDKVESLI